MTFDSFITLIRDELGLQVGPADAGRSFDDVEGWDSVHLLWLLTALERETGRQLSLPAVLSTGSLGELHALVVAA
jgi:acyl carrier protein